MTARVRQGVRGRDIMTEGHIDPDFDYEGFAQRLGESMFPDKVTSFAARIGVPQGTISKYLKGQGLGPRLDICAKIASGAGISLDWLVWGRGEGPDHTTGFIRVPRYDASLSAGTGSWNEGRRRLDDMPFTSEFIRKRLGRMSAKGLAVLDVRGDSMEPTISNGALVLVDEEDTRIVDGIFAFVLGDDARVKRLRRLTDGLQVVSDNPAYPTETIAGNEQNKLQIIGRLLWVAQTL